MTKIVIGALAASFMLISAASAQKYPERCAGIDDIAGDLASAPHDERATKAPILIPRG
jgi:hypothetical protein